MTVLIDGRATDVAPVGDRGLNYGDGLFETIAVFDGHPCLWEAHMSRLAAGCARLGIPSPDTGLLQAEAGSLCRGHDRAVLKVLLTRGEGGRGYRPPAAPVPRRILTLHPWPDHPEACWHEGVDIRWCETPLGLNPLLAGLKHCNRLEQVMARAEWVDPLIAEGLMCDVEGNVVEATQSNVFLWRNGELSTPRLDRCGVAGVARASLMDLAREQGHAVREVRIGRDDVFTADAILLTNAVIGCWPVRRLDGSDYGPAARPLELMAAFMERVRRP